MKKAFTVTAMLFCVLFLTAGGVMAQTGDDLKTHKDCKYCGMDRGQFSHSRVLIEYEDGAVVGLCSLHCAALDFANTIDRSPKSIKVGDYATRELIDAEKAVWVIGGGKPGVMSKRAKWAFAKKEEAEVFLKGNGGKAASFEEAMRAAYEDMYEDTKMIREKRKAKRAKMKESEHKH
jgi:nitrous oxide reductase accessory protein NosL